MGVTDIAFCVMIATSCGLIRDGHCEGPSQHRKIHNTTEDSYRTIIQNLAESNRGASSFAAENADVLADKNITGFFIEIVRKQALVLEELSAVAAGTSGIIGGVACLKVLQNFAYVANQSRIQAKDKITPYVSGEMLTIEDQAQQLVKKFGIVLIAVQKAAADNVSTAYAGKYLRLILDLVKSINRGFALLAKKDASPECLPAVQDIAQQEKNVLQSE